MVNEPKTIPVGAEPPPLKPSSSTNDRMLIHDRQEGHQNNVMEKSSHRRTADRFALLNSFVDFTLADLSRSDIAVWMVLYRDTKNGTARTSQADIARRAGISCRTVIRAIGRLEKRGLLVISHRGGLNRGTSCYRISPLEKDWRQVPKL
jgi:DNA-binding MarR family transcriptional regulator